MAQGKKLRYIVSFGLVGVFMTGCGGGSSGGGGSPPPPPPSPSFTLSLSPSSVTLMQGGTEQTVQVTVTGQNGFSGSVSVTASGLPTGVTVSPASLSITSGGNGSFNLSASPAAEVVQQAVSVTGVSGTLTANASLQLTVMGVAVQDPYHAIGGTLVHGFYDESRQLLFATNPGLNELDVISGVDFSVKARIAVPQPWGIDQMADGKTLVLGTAAQEIVTVDEDTFTVTQNPYAALGLGSESLFFPNVVAMANGEVLIIGQEQGVDSSDIYEAGQYLYQWNSTANTFSQLEPAAPNGHIEIDRLARSADHKWAVFAADQFYLYSSDSSGLMSVPVNTVNPPQNEFGIRGYAMNADGTEIAVASATQMTFLNRSLAVLGTTSIPGAFQTARSAIQFSSDGSRLFLEYPFPLTIEEVDANGYKALGYFSGTVIPDSDNLERMLTLDSKGRAYLGIDGGLRVVDLTQTPAPNTSDPFFTAPACPVLDAVLPLNQSQEMQLVGQAPGGTVYIGGQPAPLLNGGTTITIPASSIVGPADIECVDSYGNTSVVLNGVSYGVDPVGFSANLLPPTGNPPAYVFGYGFHTSQGAAPSVTLGGQAATNLTPAETYGFGTLQGEGFKVPSGTPGESASLEVSSSLGSGTLPSVATYYPSPTIVPASGLLQILYESHRSLLYALKATEVDVLNPTTLHWQAPLVFPAAAKGAYSAMALAPDGSKLVVSGSTATPTGGAAPQLIVLNLDNSSLASVFTYAGNAGGSGSIAITKFNTVVMPGFPGLVFDLSTSTFTSLPNFNPQVIRASADGSHLYGAQLNVSSGEVFSVDPSTYAVQSEGFGYLFWTDLAVSADGSQFAAINAPPYATGDAIGFFDSSLHYLNTNVYPDFSPPDDIGVAGAMFSPEGKVLVVPLGDSLEIWDSANGALRARLMTPEELHTSVNPAGGVAPMMAMDPTGQIIYAVSASGLTILKLPEPLDQIPSVQWSSDVRFGNQMTELHGSITQHITAMRSKLRK